MKKIVVWIAIVSMLLGLTACGQQATQSAYPGTMTELVEGIYRNCTQQPEFALGDPTPIDTSDAFALQSYLGLTDASLVQEAVFSEPMINAQAYSLCALRVAEGKNPKDVAGRRGPQKVDLRGSGSGAGRGMGRHSSAGYGQQRSGSQSG